MERWEERSQRQIYQGRIQRGKGCLLVDALLTGTGNLQCLKGWSLDSPSKVW